MNIHSVTVDPSVFTILRPRVWSPCKTSMLVQFLFELLLEKDENKEKEAKIGAFKSL